MIENLRKTAVLVELETEPEGTRIIKDLTEFMMIQAPSYTPDQNTFYKKANNQWVKHIYVKPESITPEEISEWKSETYKWAHKMREWVQKTVEAQKIELDEYKLQADQQMMAIHDELTSRIEELESKMKTLEAQAKAKNGKEN